MGPGHLKTNIYVLLLLVEDNIYVLLLLVRDNIYVLLLLVEDNIYVLLLLVKDNIYVLLLLVEDNIYVLLLLVEGQDRNYRSSVFLQRFCNSDKEVLRYAEILSNFFMSLKLICTIFSSYPISLENCLLSCVIPLKACS